MNDESTKRQGINSIEVGLKLVKELVALGRAAPLREIAQAADMHPAKAHRYLVSFVRSGMVKQTPDDGLYDLGPYAMELSLACLSRLDAVRLGSAVLEPLAVEIDESVFLAIWGAAGPTVIDWQPSRRSISASTHAGTVFPLVMSSTGRVFAAFHSSSVVEPLIETELAELSAGRDPRAPVDRAAFGHILAEVRDRGLGRGVGIRRPGINSFTAPVLDYRGRMSFALTAFGYEDTFATEWDGPIASALLRTAESLSTQLGHRTARLQGSDPANA